MSLNRSINLYLYIYLNNMLMLCVCVCVHKDWEESKNANAYKHEEPVFLSNEQFWSYSSSLWIHCFAFHGVSYIWATSVGRYEMENSRNKQFISCKLHAVLCDRISHRATWSRPTGTAPSLASTPTPRMLPTPAASHSADLDVRPPSRGVSGLCSGSPYFPY